MKIKFKTALLFLLFINNLNIFAESTSKFKSSIDIASLKDELDYASKELIRLEKAYNETESQSEKKTLAQRMTIYYQDMKKQQVMISYATFDIDNCSIDKIAEMGIQLLMINQSSEAVPLLLEAGLKGHFTSLNALGVIFYNSHNLEQSLFWLKHAYDLMTPDNQYIPILYNLSIVANESALKTSDQNDKNKLRELSIKCANQYRNVIHKFCNVKNDHALPQYPIAFFIKAVDADLLDRGKILQGRRLPR